MTGALLVLGSWLAASALLSLLLGAVVRRADRGPAVAGGAATSAAAVTATPFVPAARSQDRGPVAAEPAAPRQVPARAGAELVR